MPSAKFRAPNKTERLRDQQELAGKPAGLVVHLKEIRMIKLSELPTADEVFARLRARNRRIHRLRSLYRSKRRRRR